MIPKTENAVQSGEAGVGAMEKALFLVGNHPAKLIACLALTTFEPGQCITANALHNKIRELQKRGNGWTPKPPTLFGYCRDAMAPSGLVELIKEGKQDRSVRLTEQGIQIAPVLVGALCELELESIHNRPQEIEQPLFLQDVLGKTSYRDGRFIGAPTRFTIYKALLQLPPETSIIQAELIQKLHKETELCRATVAGTLTDLYHLRILHKERDINTGRLLSLSPELLDICIDRLRRTESRAVVAAIKSLLSEGRDEVVRGDILQRAKELEPSLPEQKITSALKKWLEYPPNAKLVQAINDGNEVTLPAEHRNYLRKLLNIQQLLTEESQAAEEFREAARKRAKELLLSPEQIFRLLWHTKMRTAGCSDAEKWKDDLRQLVPAEGIDVVKLYEKVLKTISHPMTYKTFRINLSTAAQIEITEHPTGGAMGRPTSLVRLKKERFSKNWINKAACLKEDPDLFHPLAGSGNVKPEVMAEVNIAKRICSGCPVKLPCLKKAIEVGESDGIRGGIWFARRNQELTAEEARRILHSVEIEN